MAPSCALGLLAAARAPWTPQLYAPRRVSVLAEEGRGGPSAEEPERATPRRPRPAGQRGVSPSVRPSRLSPARVGGRWAAALSHEPSGVLEHSGFGRQLLSMRLGEAGAGLSLGALHATDAHSNVRLHS